jgi:hypothetical protein
MTRLNWSANGSRFFETGVDRGVLYVASLPGVAWTGLVSIAEAPSGGTPRAYYVDGFKYLNVASAEEYEATINALSAPREFDPCDGNSRIQNGLIVTQQARKSFDLSYRTLVGNDTVGSDFGYKIHLIYNALAAPSQKSNDTFSDSGNISPFSWKITTRPPSITGYKPTAHLVIDSRYTDPEKLVVIEDLLYGTDDDPATMPTPDELIDIFNA